MKKTALLLSCIALAPLCLNAQKVTEDNFSRLTVHYNTPMPKIIDGMEKYSLISLDNYIYGGEVGAPALPVLNSQIEVPFCDGMTVTVSNAVYDTIALDATIQPLQPSVCKSAKATAFAKNEDVYTADSYYGMPLASVTPVGIARDRNLAMLCFAPVSLNHAAGKMVVCRSADITVTYNNADAARSIEYRDRYYTPAYNVGPSLNTLLSPKGVRNTAPVRLTIVAAESFRCDELENFADWKRTQGLMTDVLYFSNGVSASTIATQLKSMYDNATVDSPAPTYILLVGDVDKMKAFNSRLSSSNQLVSSYDLGDHISDHFYATWTDDDLPDCYQGRFSASGLSTLRYIIEKTMYYERYEFGHDDDYLGRAALIAGVDNAQNNNYNDNAWRCADPTMDYIAKYYVNSNNGYTDVKYYKNNTNFAPNGVTITGSSQSSHATDELRTLYSEGLGWVNYSAHGNWNEWYSPKFNTSNVTQMTNYGKPSFMIGNCCLSNKFDESACFGETLLRKSNNGGAIGYIGATNSTFWDEDFYWSVGVRNNITNSMNASYDANRLGTYDLLFHTHGEKVEDYAVTAGRILMAGCMSVNRTKGTGSWANDVVPYYWEIYELMGDPTLLPWLGKAQTLPVVSLKIMTYSWDIPGLPEGAYVAIVSNNSHALISAAYASSDGIASLPKNDDVDLDSCFISITAQGYKPFTQQYSSTTIGIEDVNATNTEVYPNPATDICHIKADGLRQVTLMNAMGQILTSVKATDNHYSMKLESVPAGVYLLRIDAANGTTVRKLIVK